MKKAVISVFILIISINAFALGTIEAEYKLQNHPLVESLDYDGSSNSLGNAFTLKLKNGHVIYFSGVKSNFTFNKWSDIHYINDVRFSTVEFEPFEKGGDYGWLRIKDFCKATGTNYNDLYSILDNYIEFCKLLNSMPWRLDKNAEKLCAKYSDNHYVYLYRGGRALTQENKFIEIPKE
ncbi:MAG: hypothetical protein J5631_11995 [Spirochaetaceae bacterium]|nr:hypothetical protein [Spirochaetaceae bacterium]